MKNIFSLAEISTKDGILHQGIVFTPSKPTKRVLLWIHGLTSRFYGDVNLMHTFAQVCEEKGLGFASFNTRGHDMVTGFHRTDVPHTYRTIGGGLEKFEESTYDIDAAVSFLTSQGYKEVVLVGHSTGANKACFYAATQNDPRVVGVVLSGTLSDRYSSGYTPEKFKETKAFMEQQIAKGKGDEPLHGYDFFVQSANRWMSLYVEGSKEDVFNYADGEDALKTFSHIAKPLMVINGAKDEHATMPMEKIQELFNVHARSSKYKGVLVSDASHSFEGKEQEVVTHICNWVESI